MFSMYLVIFLNIGFAIAETVIIVINQDILSDEYPGLWYIVLTNIILRYVFTLFTVINGLYIDEEYEGPKKFYEFPLFYISFISQLLGSLISVCILIGISGYEKAEHYYKNNYVAIYGSLVVESVWFFVILIGYCIYKRSLCTGCCTECANYCTKCCERRPSNDKLENEVKKLRILVEQMIEKNGPPKYEPSAPCKNTEAF